MKTRKVAGRSTPGRFKTGYGSTNQPIPHFGLGNSVNITFLEITWPSGLVQNFHGISKNLSLLIVEGQSQVIKTGDK